MVSFSSKTISIGPMSTPIAKFEVWFSTPFGIEPELDKAIEACASRDLDPEICIKPTPVAVGEEPNTYEVL